MIGWELWNEIVQSRLEMTANILRENQKIDASVAAPSAEEISPEATHPHFDVMEYLTQVGGITLCVLDEQGHAVSFAPNWEKQTGLSEAQCEGQHFNHFFHPQHRELFKQKLHTLQQEAPKDQSFRLQYGSTHCGYPWYECTLSSVNRRHGEQGLYVLSMREVTKDMDLQRQVRTAQSEAELAIRGRAEFLGHMSHELRTPLNAMLGFAEMMEHGVYGEITNDGYQDYLKNIRESGHMLLDRITDMMEIASIEVGSARIEESIAEPETLLEQAKNLHHHQAIMRGITIFPPAHYPLVLTRVDRAKIVRALGNIISNAIRFSDHGAEIQLECELLEDKTLAFHVIDSGEGMSTRQLEALQEAMNRSYCMFSGSPDAIGLGLGLAVAKEFTHLHDGELKLHSVKGEGTRVTLLLPPDRVTSMEVPLRQRRRKSLHV